MNERVQLTERNEISKTEIDFEKAPEAEAEVHKGVCVCVGKM